jgi:hypothetical protein
MNPRRTTLTVAAAAAVCAALAGCNANADAITSVTTTGTAASSPTTPSSTTTTSLDAAAQETKDRQDAELVWRKFNGLTITMASLPADQAEQAFQQVAVDPQLTRLRTGYATLKSRHEAGYGQDISVISWPEPIAGRDTVTLNDCQDGSQAGYLDTATGNKLTVGTPNTPAKGTLQRTPQGWRVVNAELDQVNKCTPGV